MPEYALVSRQLARVRLAWKRNAALSGLLAVLVELIGLFTLAILVDVLYRPGLEGRVALLAICVGIVAYFAARHVARPLLLKIPDAQIALYVEEHHPEFEGALLSAAEFGRVRGVSEQQQDIIDAIVEEAVVRARRFGLRSALDLSRLRKYGIAAGVAVVFYLVLGAFAPKAMVRHATRVLVPWRASGESPLGRTGRAEDAGPITFTLSTGDTKLLRGTPFEMDTELSRRPDAPVLFHFRPVAEQPGGGLPGEIALPVVGEGGRQAGPLWRTIAMRELEKVNGFGIVLPDVNEDLLYQVSSGTHRTREFSIQVYDPIRLEGFQIATKFPKYLDLADAVTEQATGDVSALEGSTVTVRILTNALLAEGELTWADGQTQPLAVAGGRGNCAEASFTVERDRSYNFLVRDVHGQDLASLAPAIVHAIKDGPPTVEVKLPKIDLVAHPLAEVTFLVEAKDDWGVESVEMVLRRGMGPGAKPRRLSLTLEDAGPAGRKARTTVKGRLHMPLEDFEPTLRAGELMTYHFEVFDMKKNAVISDIFFVKIRPFEVWSTWVPLPLEEGAGAMMYVPAALERYVAAAWHLHSQKETFSRQEYEKACEKLAEEFTSEGMTLWDYVREPP